jgi:hypothetical protein
MPRDGREQARGDGLVHVDSLAWITGLVADADETAAWIEELMDARRVEVTAAGPREIERTIDLAVGDIVVRLVTPMSAESRYAPVLSSGARVWSFALRVPDLDDALAALGSLGIPTIHRTEGFAATEPAATLGIPIEWTQ